MSVLCQQLHLKNTQNRYKVRDTENGRVVTSGEGSWGAGENAGGTERQPINVLQSPWMGPRCIRAILIHLVISNLWGPASRCLRRSNLA